MSRLLRYFQKISVINLPARVDRYREMADQLAIVDHGFDHPGVELFPAIRPHEPGGLALGFAMLQVLAPSSGLLIEYKVVPVLRGVCK